MILYLRNKIEDVHRIKIFNNKFTVMKIKWLPFLIVSFCTCFFTSCPGPEYPDDLSVSPTNLTFSSDDTGEQSIEISTNVPIWSYNVVGGDWINTSRRGDNKLNVSVQNYTNTGSSRTATITIIAGVASPVDVLVEQNFKVINTLSINPNAISYGSREVGDKTVLVTTNASSWKAETEASWIKLTQQENTLKITVSEENSGTSERKANIKITAGNATDVNLTVTQEGIPVISYNTAEGKFFGDYNDTGTGYFSIKIFNKTNKDEEIGRAHV